MRILVDENIPQMTVAALLELGHDVRDLRGTARQGVTDEQLWEIASTENRLLITTDKGFLVKRDSKHAGVLIVRLRQPNRQRIHNRVIQGLARFREDQWPAIVVVMRDRTMSVWRKKKT